ncbi:hypothetical protein [Niveispirillum sp. BGYR6]|uniref:hypothetical protein n=1 Tax=Niveispirillum sp. BGYR6 TaxID=2971249 RepID=UPI0022B998D0|nr:hypothetical protein [Niveispirillum sp. BGYR6]MDG5494053.1 hypothetical protein [Niveispirillum sp. BGYR6]
MAAAGLAERATGWDGGAASKSAKVSKPLAGGCGKARRPGRGGGKGASVAGLSLTTGVALPPAAPSDGRAGSGAGCPDTGGLTSPGAGMGAAGGGGSGLGPATSSAAAGMGSGGAAGVPVAGGVTTGTVGAAAPGAGAAGISGPGRGVPAGAGKGFPPGTGIGAGSGRSGAGGVAVPCATGG